MHTHMYTHNTPEHTYTHIYSHLTHTNTQQSLSNAIHYIRVTYLFYIYSCHTRLIPNGKINKILFLSNTQSHYNRKHLPWSLASLPSRTRVTGARRQGLKVTTPPWRRSLTCPATPTLTWERKGEGEGERWEGGSGAAAHTSVISCH